MKKVLIAALATAFAAPAASYAATSNVDVYGRFAASYNVLNTDTNVAGQDKTLYQVSSNNSYIGFKGNEDLGGGLKAIYQLEVGIDVDGGNGGKSAGSNLSGAFGGTNSFAYRNTFVGLSSSDYGTVLLGRHDTPYKMATSKLDVFGNEPADYRNVIGNIGGTQVFAQRTGNTIAYVTPNIMGFTGVFAYVAGNEIGNGPAPNADAWSVAGMYNNGPIFASLAYERHNNVTAAGTDDHAWKAGVGYDFGPGKIGLVYEDATAATIWDTLASYVPGATTTSRSAVLLDGAYNVTGNVVLKASWGHLGNLSNTTTGGTGANSYAVGADYVFSKRTKLIAQYQKISNDSHGTYGVGFGTNNYYAAGTGYSGGTTGAPGNSPSIISVGIVHTF